MRCKEYSQHEPVGKPLTSAIEHRATCDRNYARRANHRAGGRPSAGFTLVEMMVVVTMVGILAAVALVAYTRHIRSGRILSARQLVGEIQAREETYYQQHGTYVSALDGANNGFYPGLTVAEPESKPWAAPPAGWLDLGARPDQGASFFAFKVVASQGPGHALDAEATALQIPAQPAAPMTPHAWYYVIGVGDMDGDAAGGCMADPLTSTSCTVMTATSARSAVVVKNQGE